MGIATSMASAEVTPGVGISSHLERCCFNVGIANPAGVESSSQSDVGLVLLAGEPVFPTLSFSWIQQTVHHRLSSYTTYQELKSLFSAFGVVTEARLITDPKTQRPKGFGFVTFQSENEAQEALKAMNGRIVRGRLIFVEVANSGSPENGASSS
ncbi:hypothetical protein JRO89_XS10G0135100 [Xanthoceras sorbifolium]|uniref:RRM domain-containing protein n=1 Tax=Xanthoceras sorbifolium TaxID=99658 RepID=A0ABQ8HIM1_9ROSI|nr:hypothetical protein JRO89_XS10G0135100 [Xanthoceras sorbifolium]